MFKKSWLKVCALFAVMFVGAAQLPALAAEAELTAEEAAMQRKYAESVTKGVVKGFTLDPDKKVTAAQQAEIRRIAGETFPKILAEVKRAGLYDEYKAVTFDPEVDRMNEEIMSVKEPAELRQLAERQIGYIRKKYPRLTDWLNSSPEVNAIVSSMMQKISGVLAK